MLDLANDTNCVEVEQALFEYAQSVLNKKQARRAFFAGGGQKAEWEKNYQCTHWEQKCAILKLNFERKFKAFIGSKKNPDDKKQINGRFLWMMVDLYNKGMWRKNELSGRCRDFVSEGLDLAQYAIVNYELSSKDKIRFLEHVIANGFHREVNSDKGQKISKQTLNVLASFNPHLLEQSVMAGLHEKTLENLEAKNRNNGAEINIFFELFKTYIANVRVVADDTLKEYGMLYFMMADKTKDSLDIGVLEKMVSKTSEAVKVAGMCGEEEVWDKKAVVSVFEQYAQYLRKGDKVNHNLTMQMQKFAENAFRNADYTVKDVLAILQVLDSQKFEGTGKNIKKKELSLLAANIANVARENKYIMTSPLNRNDGFCSYDDKLEYVENLFDRVQKGTAGKIKIDKLWNLAEQKCDDDKNFVLDVAKIYVESSCCDMEKMNNRILFEKMINFYQNVITENEFTPEEVAAIAFVFRKEADKCEDFERLADVIVNSACSKNDHHLVRRENVAISPLVLKKCGGKGRA